MAAAEVVYLTCTALLTAAALVVVRRAWPGDRGGSCPLWLVPLWGLLVAGMQPATRLTFDLAFLFGSQLTIVVAVALWLAALRRAGRAGSRARTRASSPGGGGA